MAWHHFILVSWMPPALKWSCIISVTSGYSDWRPRSHWDERWHWASSYQRITYNCLLTNNSGEMPIQIHNQIRFADTSLGGNKMILETGRAGLNFEIITFISINGQPFAWFPPSSTCDMHIALYFYFSGGEKKTSLMISALINERPQSPSSSQDNLIAGVQLSNRLKKKQRAHGQ